MDGIIIKNISNDYLVKTDNGLFNCKPRGKFRNDKLVPLVGDNVIIDSENNYIMEIKPRRNELIRPSVANIDMALIVTSVTRPYFNTNLLDKLLTIISYNNIEPVICLTKLDLLEDDKEISEYISYYKKIGYKVITNNDINKIKELIKNKLVILTGQSGSGKSTLINKLDSSLNLKTDDISESLNRGKHTTRHTEIYPIFDGYIVDTPGFSSLDFIGMSKIDIRDNMKEMFDNLEYCKYRDCLHIREDNCKVKELVGNNIILKSRYNNYVEFIKNKDSK